MKQSSFLKLCTQVKLMRQQLLLQLVGEGRGEVYICAYEQKAS